jgi:hypothetical protein
MVERLFVLSTPLDGIVGSNGRSLRAARITEFFDKLFRLHRTRG